MFDLTGRVVLITGGSRGIGAATAVKFAESGANVAITYASRRIPALKVLRRVGECGSEGLMLRGAVEKYSDCEKILKQVMRKFGRIDALVNNAGIWEEGDILTMTRDEWAKTIDINLNGVFNMTRVIAPVMKKQKYGRIINVASTAGIRGEAYHSHYAASKGGVIAFTKSIAVELIQYGINANCVAPGWVETDMTSRVFKNKKLRKEALNSIPRRTVPIPDDIAGSILFLASNLSNHIVGEVLNVNGGSLLSS